MFPKYTEFTKRYCDAKRDFRFGFWNTNGCSNVDELHGTKTKTKQDLETKSEGPKPRDQDQENTTKRPRDQDQET